jgi:hypothetical protein
MLEKLLLDRSRSSDTNELLLLFLGILCSIIGAIWLALSIVTPRPDIHVNRKKCIIGLFFVVLGIICIINVKID